MKPVQTCLKTNLKECVRFSVCIKTLKKMRKRGHTDDD